MLSSHRDATLMEFTAGPLPTTFSQMFSVSALPDISDDSLSCCWRQICYLLSNPFSADQTSVGEIIFMRRMQISPAPSWLMQADFPGDSIQWKLDFLKFLLAKH